MSGTFIFFGLQKKNYFLMVLGVGGVIEFRIYLDMEFIPIRSVSQIEKSTK